MSRPLSEAELGNLTDTTLVELLAVKANLIEALKALEKLKKDSDDQAGAAEIKQIKENLKKISGSEEKIRTAVYQFNEMATRLKKQYISALSTFESGWNARYYDILARVSREDAKALRRIIEMFDEHTLPF